MFKEEPEQLPCGQHDKFKAEREAMGALIKKNPVIIPIMVMGLSDW